MNESMAPSLRSAESELTDPELRRHLERFLRRRMPAPDADDALQAVYCAALEARTRPAAVEELRRWMTVVARRKIAAYYQRSSRELVGELPEVEACPAPLEAQSLLRWAEREADTSENAHQTLDWMARESDGEKLEAIAAEAHVPAARVRQRVFRMRRFLKARWALEIAAALVAVTIVAWWLIALRAAPMAKSSPVPRPTIVMPDASNEQRAVELRRDAMRTCDLGRWHECLRGLDEAARLDPAGDAEPSVVRAREKAMKELTAPPIVPEPVPPVRSPTTTSTGTPRSTTPATGSH